MAVAVTAVVVRAVAMMVGVVMVATVEGETVAARAAVTVEAEMVAARAAVTVGVEMRATVARAEAQLHWSSRSRAGPGANVVSNECGLQAARIKWHAVLGRPAWYGRRLGSAAQRDAGRAGNLLPEYWQLGAKPWRVGLAAC